MLLTLLLTILLFENEIIFPLGWMLEEQGTDESKYDKMMPTVVKPKQTDLFSIESLPLELGIIR